MTRAKTKVAVKIEMCRYYSVKQSLSMKFHPVCAKNHRASLKCHSKRDNCLDYNHSWGFIQGKENNGHIGNREVINE